MARILKLLLLCVLTAGCASTHALRDDSDGEVYTPPPGAIVLRVEVLAGEFTDVYVNCLKLDGECILSRSFYKYRARVKETISGEWTQAEVEFAYLQHGQYIDKVTRDCYVVLLPMSPQRRALLHVPFEADELISRVMTDGPARIKRLRASAKPR